MTKKDSDGVNELLKYVMENSDDNACIDKLVKMRELFDLNIRIKTAELGIIESIKQIEVM